MSKLMITQMANLRRLSLLVQRMQDAEQLLATEGARLLIEIGTACHLLEAGDTEAPRGHIEQVIRFLEELVATDVLPPEDVRPVIQTAYSFLNLKAAGEASG